MARTAKTVELSKIINIETGKAYAVSFVKTMEMVGKDQSEWPMLEKIMSTSSEIESKQAKEKREKREANANKKAERVAEILAELDVKLPEGILLKSVEVKPKGPMIDELDEEGKKTGEKIQMSATTTLTFVGASGVKESCFARRCPLVATRSPRPRKRFRRKSTISRRNWLAIF